MKKNISYLFATLAVIVLFLLICVSDGNNGSDSPEALEEKTEEVVETLLEDPIESVDENSNVETITNDTEEAKQIKEEIKEIVKDQIKKSELKNTECEEIMEKYETIAKKFIETLDDKVFLEIAEWYNDPIFQNCIKQEPYKTRYDELQTKMDEAEGG